MTAAKEGIIIDQNGRPIGQPKQPFGFDRFTRFQTFGTGQIKTIRGPGLLFVLPLILLFAFVAVSFALAFTLLGAITRLVVTLPFRAIRALSPR